MSDNRNYAVFYVVIGALIIIILSLVFTLYNEGFIIFPQWVIEAIIVGLFTLTGAGTGAFLAGQFTLKSVNNQIEHSKAEAERTKEANNNNALRILDYLLEDLFGVLSYAVIPFKERITQPILLKKSINELDEPIKKIETVLQNTELLAKISDEYIIEIPSKIRMQISHLKNILKSVNEHNFTFTEEYVKTISENLVLVNEGLQTVRDNIKIITENTSANR